MAGTRRPPLRVRPARVGVRATTTATVTISLAADGVPVSETRVPAPEAVADRVGATPATSRAARGAARITAGEALPRLRLEATMASRAVVEVVEDVAGEAEEEVAVRLEFFYVNLIENTFRRTISFTLYLNVLEFLKAIESSIDFHSIFSLLSTDTVDDSPK